MSSNHWFARLPKHLSERTRRPEALDRLTPPESSGAFVLYWMRTASRGHENPALDTAIAAANHLGIPAVALPPGAPMDDEATAEVREQVRDAAVTVVADVEIGVGNLPNLEAATAAEDLMPASAGWTFHTWNHRPHRRSSATQNE